MFLRTLMCLQLSFWHRLTQKLFHSRKMTFLLFWRTYWLGLRYRFWSDSLKEIELSSDSDALSRIGILIYRFWSWTAQWSWRFFWLSIAHSWNSDMNSETDSLSEVDVSSDSEVLTDWVFRLTLKMTHSKEIELLLTLINSQLEFDRTWNRLAEWKLVILLILMFLQIGFPDTDSETDSLKGSWRFLLTLRCSGLGFWYRFWNRITEWSWHFFWL